MSSDILSANQTTKTLHTQEEIKGLEDQGGREGAIKEGGKQIFKEDVRNEREEVYY